MVLDVTVELLKTLGFSVTAYDNGNDAVRFMEEKGDRIDLVLLDLTMPNMGGGETFDRIRKIDPDKKILLCSGYGRDSQAEEILTRGCNGFIQKPYNVEDLANKINEILAG
jgi:CheY-like chemotaxis protein